MSLAFHWFLPTNGDGRRLVETDRPTPGVAGGTRPATPVTRSTATDLICSAWAFESAGNPPLTAGSSTWNGWSSKGSVLGLRHVRIVPKGCGTALHRDA